MDGRHHYHSLRRLRLFAGEADLTADKVRHIIQPFIEEWRPIKVPNRKDAPAPMDVDPSLQLSAPALTDLSARIRAIGMNLNKSGQRGIYYHNAFQRQLAGLATSFDCLGWTESEARFDEPGNLIGGNGAPGVEFADAEALPPAQLTGRVDVLWARRRVPVAVFEIDSTVKARSFQKLLEAAAPHRFWVYFGKDVWGFRTFLKENDPGRAIVPILIPRTFIPSFDDHPGSPPSPPVMP